MTKSSALVLSVVVLLQLHAQPGRAQTSTGDAIDAFVRGDYQRAAEILTPITNRWPGPVDAAANFFMAGLYENGLGVPRDPVRACALYFRSGPERLFGGMNLGTLLPRLQRTLTTNQAGECTLLANLGFDHRFQPATFTLEPGYWIEIALSTEIQAVSATVAYQGRTKAGELALTTPPGVMFLPIEHTELAVRGAPGRRHFIQIPTWNPEPSLNEWHLVWSLFEVVRDDVVTIAHEVVAIAPGNTRPTDPRVNLSKLVALRVNVDGNAEWALLAGPEARSR